MSDQRPETVEPQRPVLAQKPPAAPVATNTVWVACKHSTGLELTYYDQVETKIANPQGVETALVSRRNAARSFVVEGPTSIVNPHAAGPHLMRFREQFGGYAITPGVSRELWDHWSKINYVMIDAKIIAGFNSQEDAVKWCRAQRDVRSGLEPIDPADPAASTGIRGIQPGTSGPA